MEIPQNEQEKLKRLMDQVISVRRELNSLSMVKKEKLETRRALEQEMSAMLKKYNMTNVGRRYQDDENDVVKFYLINKTKPQKASQAQQWAVIESVLGNDSALNIQEEIKKQYCTERTVSTLRMAENGGNPH